MASLSLRTNQAAHLSGAYLGFFSMKRLGVFLLPHGWDISPSQGTHNSCPPTLSSSESIHLGGERRCQNKVFCPRTQHNVPGQGSLAEPGRLTPESSALTMRPPRLLAFSHNHRPEITSDGLDH